MAEIDIDNAPRKAKEHFEKGFAAMERGNLDYAIEMFTLSLDVCPQLLKTRKFMRAAQVKKFRTNPPSQMKKAMIPVKAAGKQMKIQSLMKKDPVAALKVSEELLSLDPFNTSFVGLNVQAATAADMPEVAILTLEVAKESNDTDVKFLRQLAKLYQQVDRMHDARGIYEEIAAINPSDQQAIKDLKDATALDTMQRGHWTEEGDFRDKVKDAKESALLEQEGKAVKSSKDIDSLIKENLGKVEAEPQNINYRRALADLYVRAERFDDALDALKKAQEITGGADPQIDRAISNAYLKKLDFEIAQFEADGDAEHAATWRQEKESFKFDDAKEKVERYPNDLVFKFELGQILYKRNEFNEAVQLFQLAQRNPQKRIDSLLYMGLCFKQKKQYDIALEQLQKAATELPVMNEIKKEILYELGQISEAMGNHEKAVVYYKEIYGVDISYRDVSAKIESFYDKK